jgi:hypothetical protein
VRRVPLTFIDETQSGALGHLSDYPTNQELEVRPINLLFRRD